MVSRNNSVSRVDVNKKNDNLHNFCFCRVFLARRTFRLSESSGSTTESRYREATRHRRGAAAVRERKGGGMSPMRRRLPSDCTLFQIFVLTFMHDRLGIINDRASLTKCFLLRREPGGGSSRVAVHLIRISRNPARYMQQAGDYQVIHSIVI